MVRVWASLLLVASLSMLGNSVPVQKVSSAGREVVLATRSAVCLADSSCHGNYRYQADLCKANPIFRKWGFKEKNTVMLSYDNLTNNLLNPRSNIIISLPRSQDVYTSIQKDYIGNQVTSDNLYAVHLCDKSVVCNVCDNVVDSEPIDQIFLHCAGHESSDVFGMPNLIYLHSSEFIKLSKSYEKMVIYIETCKSGCIFEGVIPEELHVYVTTASNTKEKWGTYCLGVDSSPQSTMESKGLQHIKKDILVLRKLYEQLDDSSEFKARKLKEVDEFINHLLHLHSSVELIGRFIFGPAEGASIILRAPMVSGVSVDLKCTRFAGTIFESHCGIVTQYGLDYIEAFLNICSMGVPMETFEAACVYACGGYNSGKWNPLSSGFTY